MEATQLGIYCGNNYEAEEVSLLRGGAFPLSIPAQINWEMYEAHAVRRIRGTCNYFKAINTARQPALHTQREGSS